MAIAGIAVTFAFSIGWQDTLSAADLDTGYLNPSTNAADTGGDGDGFEYHPDYAYSDGSGAAESYHAYGDRHRYGGYNVSVPAGATIKGIEVRADWWVDMGWTENQLCVQLSWNGGADWTTAKCDLAFDEVWVERTVVLGSSTDTWGHTWTTGELSNSNFVVRVEIWSDMGQRFRLD